MGNAPARPAPVRGRPEVAVARARPTAEAAYLQIQCYQCRRLMNLAGPSNSPTAVQCPYCNTINGIEQRGGVARVGGARPLPNQIRVDERDMLPRRREQFPRRAPFGEAGSDSEDDAPRTGPQLHEFTEELVQRLQHARRMHPAELLLVREVLEQLQGQAASVNPGASSSQIDRLTSAWVVDEKTSKHMKGNCTICLEDFQHGNKVRTLPCLHSFHSHCVEEWLDKSRVCPNCQFDIVKAANDSTAVGAGSSAGAT
jgi:E3 ubiquitin-protein ligase SDIR1